MRTRRLTRFAAPLVVVVGGCGSAPFVDDDDGVPDARPDTWPGTENPPAPFLGNECYEQPALVDGTTDCQTYVCNTDPSCCTTAWDARCADLAASICGTEYCPSSVATGGDQRIDATDGGASPRTIALPGDGPVATPSWHYDGYIHRVAVVGECAGRIFGGTYADPMATEPQFARELDGCAELPAEQRFAGRRVRWADVDHDGAIDAAFAGRGGAWWVRGNGGSTFTLAGDIVAASDGALADLAFADVDGDQRLDAIAAFEGGPARWYRQTPAHTFELQAWTSDSSGFAELAVCGLRGDGARAVVLAGPAVTEAYAIEGGDLGGERLFAAAPAAHVACGDLLTDTYPGEQEVVLARTDGAVVLLGDDGATRWSSTVDLDPPIAIDAAGVAVSVLGVLLAPAGADGDRPILVLDRASRAPVTWSDPAPGVAAIGVSPAP